MAKKKTKLSENERNFITTRETAINHVLAVLKGGGFKEGDFLIAYNRANSWWERSLIKNSYGATKKFTVVHVDGNGIPYMKELNKTGDPSGGLICPIEFDAQRGIRQGSVEFEVDPDYTDAIILDDEANYNASEVMKAKSDEFKAITEHNKKIKIPLRETSDVIAFLKNIKVGDVFYRSVKTHFTILNLSPAHFRLAHINKTSKFGEAQDSKGNTIELTWYDFASKALYTAPPRSYNELKDPK